MILKELDPFTGTEPFELAGRRAEEQMAFYLRRAFGHDPEVFVMNGLRLEREGDACQIDHLLVHPFGFVIVESKSVTTEVAIDAKGDWSRLVDGRWRGMPSPLNQAKLQIELLRLILDDHAPQALGKILGMQKRFGGLHYDAFAAVSDNGIINWPPGDKYETVCKADGTCELIKNRLKFLKGETGLSGLAKGLFDLRRETVVGYSMDVMLKVAKHLQTCHAPREAPVALAAPPKSLSSSVLVLPGDPESGPNPKSKSGCADCSTRLSPRVMAFCRVYPNRFAGKVLCMTCQAKYPVS
jgi:hypothetical protein